MGCSVNSVLRRLQPSAQPGELAQVYQSHIQRVSGWAWRLGGPREDIADVVQEVFVIAARRWSGFDGNHLDTWLFRITENVVRGLRRRARWRSWLAAEPDEVA